MRSKAREAVFILVFADLFNEGTSENLKKPIYKSQELSEDDISFADTLFATIQSNYQSLTQKIEELVPAYSFERIYPADRSALLIGMAEIIYLSSLVPKKVAINEAVGLVRKYSSETSTNFVNGILASLVNQE